MKVCVVGAGAIGGFLGTRLAAAGQAEVTALARGATLQALRLHGWRLIEHGALLQVPARAEDDPRTIGVQDVVVLTVKAPSLPALAPYLAPLLGPDTIVVPAMNGVPWWFAPVTPALAAAPLESVDPGGVVARALPVAQVVGCVVHVAASTVEPALVAHQIGHRLIIGEPRGGTSERVRHLGALLGASGLEVTCSPRIRHDIWYKLWGNMTANPMSVLTGATVEQMLDDELLVGFASSVMREAAMIGARIECTIEQTPEDRMAILRRLGAFRTSMLQDADAGRPLELDALIGTVSEIGHRVGVATPATDALFGLARLLGRVRGIYPAA